MRFLRIVFAMLGSQIESARVTITTVGWQKPYMQAKVFAHAHMKQSMLARN